MKKLSIVLPAKNEEKRISKTLSNYGAFFDSHKDDVKPEIIVVVNNTNDATAKCVADYSQKYPFIRLIETPYASGKGGAVALGFANAEGDYIGYFDADGAVSASEIYKLYEFIDETPWLDGVLGIRDFSTVSFKRRLLAKLYKTLARVFFGLPYKDTQCAAKIFKRKPALEIAKKLTNTGWTFDVNLLLVARYLNQKLIEQNVVWTEKEGSKLSMWEALVRVPFELLSLKVIENAHSIENTFSRFLNHRVHKSGHPHIKRILIFAWRDIKHPEMGGSEVYVHEVAKRLAREHHVTLFTSKPGNLSDRDVIDNVHIVRRGGMLTVYIWAFIYYVLYFRKDMDFVVDVENGLPFFTPLFCGKPKLMVLHHVHKGQWFKQFSLPLALVGYVIESFVMPAMYRNTNVITVSPSTLSELRRIGFIDRKIYLGFNSIPSRVGSKVNKAKEPLLVYVGRVKAYKRLEMAVETLRSLSKAYPTMQLIIGGAGDHAEKINKLVERYQLQRRVQILGFISEKKKWELMQKAWVFLMPSSKEGWGITIVEAASCGTPAVGFNVPGVRDSIKDGITGILARDEIDYVKSVKRLLDDKKLREKMGYYGVFWAKKFSWNSTVKVFETVVNAIYSGDGLLRDKIYPWELDVDLRDGFVVTSIV